MDALRPLPRATPFKLSLFCDAGTTAAGVALFGGDAVLLHASLARGKSKDLRAVALDVEAKLGGWHGRAVFDELVVEVPRINEGNTGVPDKDVVKLARAAGAVVGRVGPLFVTVVEYLPFRWKKHLKKSVAAQRFLTRLSDEERARIEWPAESLRHNVSDAVGIGLYHLRRWSP